MFLSINSADRTSSSVSSNDFQVRLPHDIKGMKSLELVSCSVPNTVYNIRTGTNDKLDFYDGANKTITVAAGAYSITSLCSTLLTQLNTTSSGFTAVSYDTITMKVTITRSSNFSLLFATGANIATSIRRELGFNATDLSAAVTFTGQNVINLYNPMSCYICVNEFYMPNQTSSGKFYTFHIPMTVNSDGIVVVNKNSFYAQSVKIYGNTSFSTLTIKLKTSDGLDFALNNTNFEMVLKLDN